MGAGLSLGHIPQCVCTFEHPLFGEMVKGGTSVRWARVRLGLPYPLLHLSHLIYLACSSCAVGRVGVVPCGAQTAVCLWGGFPKVPMSGCLPSYRSPPPCLYPPFTPQPFTPLLQMGSCVSMVLRVRDAALSPSLEPPSTQPRAPGAFCSSWRTWCPCPP